MRNRNAVKRVWQNFIAGIAITILLAGCQNPGVSYNPSSAILPAMADTSGSSLDLTIPLDTAVIASNPQRFAVRGKYIAIDPGSTGQANLRLNSISDTARLAYPGSTFNPGDFTDLYFDYQAQPGKILHVLYGDSPDILSSGVKQIQDPALNATIYTNAVTNGAGVIDIVVSATNNIRGIKILNGALGVDLVDGVATLASSAFTIDNGGTERILTGLDKTVSAGAGVSHFDSKGLDPIIIPPGFNLKWHGVSQASSTASGILNYQLL